jgi:hypothetical protein
MDHHYMDEKKASQFMKEARVSQGVGNIAQRFCTALLHHHHSVTSDLPDWCKATPTDVTLPPIDDAGVEGGAPDNLTGGQGPINLQNTMERILELQGEFSSLNTPEMQERGQLVRKEAPAIIRKWISKEKITDCEGRDGTGRKTRVPWFRVYLEEHSPSATKGWYLVYLFARDGSSVYLSLNQGTTKLVGKQFIPRDPTEIERRRSMALQRIKPLRHKWNGDMRIDLRDDKKLAKGYEAADVLHIRYRATIIPDDAELKEDLLRMMKYLQRLYDWKGQW